MQRSHSICSIFSFGCPAITSANKLTNVYAYGRPGWGAKAQHCAIMAMASIRAGLSVGATTDVSSLEDQVRKYKARTLPVPKVKPNKYTGYKESKTPNLSHESLALKCVKQLVANFEQLPAGDNIPTKYIREVTSRLPLTLDPKVAGEAILCTRCHA